MFLSFYEFINKVYKCYQEQGPQDPAGHYRPFLRLAELRRHLLCDSSSVSDGVMNVEAVHLHSVTVSVHILALPYRVSLHQYKHAVDVVDAHAVNLMLDGRVAFVVVIVLRRLPYRLACT